MWSRSASGGLGRVSRCLAGRRPPGRVPRWLTTSGGLALAGGLALLGLATFATTGGNDRDSKVWVLVAITGGVSVLLGACAMAPGYVSILEPVAARLSGPWRLAARGLARQRTRTGGVVSAVCATGALAICASSLMLGADLQDRREPTNLPANEVHIQSRSMGLDPMSPHPRVTSANKHAPRAVPADQEGVARLQQALPEARTLGLTAASPPAELDFGSVLEGSIRNGADRLFDTGRPFTGGAGSSAVIADDAAIDAYRLDQRARRSLAEVGAVWLGFGEGPARATLVPTGTAPAAVMGAGGTDTVPSPDAPAAISIPVVVFDRGHLSLAGLPELLLTPAVAERYGFFTGPGDVILRTPKPLSSEQRYAVDEIIDDGVGSAAEPGTAYTNVTVYQPNGRPDALLLEGVLAAAALLFTLFVVAVSLALAAAETRDERDVLAVVGVAPALLRRTSGRSAILLTGLGALLAIPVGFLPIVVFTQADTTPLPLVFPWRIVALLLIAVPLIAGTVTYLGSAFSLWRRPVRISTMAFD